MSLNCLTCGPGLRRTDSDNERRREEKSRFIRACCGVDRSWSGNLAPHAPLYGSMRRASSKNLDKCHRRRDSAGDEPKLIRSGGMRRDWSFENLRQRINDRKLSHEKKLSNEKKSLLHDNA